MRWMWQIRCVQEIRYFYFVSIFLLVVPNECLKGEGWCKNVPIISVLLFIPQIDFESLNSSNFKLKIYNYYFQVGPDWAFSSRSADDSDYSSGGDRKAGAGPGLVLGEEEAGRTGHQHLGVLIMGYTAHTWLGELDVTARSSNISPKSTVH